MGLVTTPEKSLGDENRVCLFSGTQWNQLSKVIPFGWFTSGLGMFRWSHFMNYVAPFCHCSMGAPGRGNLCVSLIGCLSCPMPSPDLQPCWQSSAISVLRLHRVHITLSVLRTPRPRRCVLIHAAATAIASAPKMKKLHVKYDVPSRHKYSHDNRG